MTKSKYIYEVSKGSSTTDIFSSSSYPAALNKYMKTPESFGIQRYTREEGGKKGWTAGLLQPDIKALNRKGKRYVPVYIGGFKIKSEADQWLKGLEPSVRKQTIIHKTKRGGYRLYTEWEKPVKRRK